MANASVFRNTYVSDITDCINEEVRLFPVQRILMYLYDQAFIDALPELAKQNDVLGVFGWDLAKTDEQKRSVLNEAEVLRLKAGTPSSIRKAFIANGFYDIEILESIDQPLYDGTWKHDGTITYGFGANAWATFSVIVDLGDKGISAESKALIVDLVNAYKNARSKLLGVGYRATKEDSVTVSEEWSAEVFKDGVYLKTIS